jgi:hypothetical protein
METEARNQPVHCIIPFNSGRNSGRHSCCKGRASPLSVQLSETCREMVAGFVLAGVDPIGKAGGQP